MKVAVLLIAALATYIAPASAAVSGNKAQRICRNGIEANDSQCLFLLMGIIDGFDAGIRMAVVGINDVKNEMEKPRNFPQIFVDDLNSRFAFCTPDGVTEKQAAEVIVKYFNDHPEKLHLDAALIAQAALREAFPCTAQRE